jgi:hypothetical protein
VHISHRLPRLGGALRAAVIAGAAALALPGAALAAPPTDSYHVRNVDNYDSNVCGIEVDVEYLMTQNYLARADGSWHATSSMRTTFTNPLTGKALVYTARGVTKAAAGDVDEDAGTITFSTSLQGVFVQFGLAQGPVLLNDVGRAVIRTVIDTQTGEIISSIVELVGQHPVIDGGVLTCEDIVPALS